MVKKSLVLLNALDSFSFTKLQQVHTYFQDISEVLRASSAHLRHAGLSAKEAEWIVNFREAKEFQEELSLIEAENVNLISIYDKEYPVLLKEIAEPPVLLYAKGKDQLLSTLCVGIVGSRLASEYGKHLAQVFAHELALRGVTVVSGLARGIDTWAHKGALETGSTIAVLGSGLARIYPPENKALFEEITRTSCVVSEFPINEAPDRANFPRRNRIISGLCAGVVIVEAALKSGALITAHYACEQNREVFALPGAIHSSLSKGTHQLIKEGAKLVDSVEDVLCELRMPTDMQKRVAVHEQK